MLLLNFSHPGRRAPAHRGLAGEPVQRVMRPASSTTASPLSSRWCAGARCASRRMQTATLVVNPAAQFRRRHALAICTA